MSAKNPNRYGKNSWPVSTTVPKEIYEKMQALADQGGLRVTAWARQALTEAARSEAVYGMSKLKTIPFHAPETMRAAEEPGDSIARPSAMSGGGSETAREPVQYTPKGRKGGE